MMPPVAPRPPSVNPLQRFWLREIGMERLWLRPAPAAERPAPQPQVPVSKPVLPAEAPAAPASAPAPARPAAAEPAAPPATGRPGIPASILNRSGPPPRPAPKVAEEAPPPAPIPVAEAVRNASLDEMREQVVACEACGLCKGRRNAVFGHGGQPTRWLVVGEAPGEQEDRQGQPFVGRSGQLLDAMLSAVSMSRERDVFITNVIKCRPPGNRNPKPEEIAACSPYLMRQIALLKPQRILVLGRFAAQTLLGTDATIGSLRGRIHQLKTEDGQQIPVVVSYHPAYLLRSPAEKARAWQDLKLAARMD
ncbi:uracil-DNA glycosylase [Achromobacter sp. HZ01]|uniref:Type-4 uracil-DNA glycosylase n=1 Tax=Achromobacter pulmonis TaxID=1389932 RepID=A0A2N8KFE2_9BURK|nr:MULTISPECIES: uracil-DNA glycosylase [Achromobacter]MBO9328653.1 uracil-DNA glycosylase [Achromobacter xylosoxidans]PND32160.1 uracil-DNA glycosylase [Achromobacter pulmonis]RAP62092.1 uracil-DNA glycosylase [Achromobacter sp. HZ01]